MDNQMLHHILIGHISEYFELHKITNITKNNKRQQIFFSACVSGLMMVCGKNIITPNTAHKTKLNEKPVIPRFLLPDFIRFQFHNLFFSVHTLSGNIFCASRRVREFILFFFMYRSCCF